MIFGSFCSDFPQLFSTTVMIDSGHQHCDITWLVPIRAMEKRYTPGYRIKLGPSCQPKNDGKEENVFAMSF